jgi:hypothetical protein
MEPGAAMERPLEAAMERPLEAAMERPLEAAMERPLEEAMEHHPVVVTELPQGAAMERLPEGMADKDQVRSLLT